MFKTRLSAFLTVLAALVVAQGSFGWTSIGKWSGTSFTMRASSVSFPSGSSYRTALGTVTSRFNVNPGKIRMTQSYDDTSIGFNNGQNEVWFSADSTHSPAVCYTWKNIWGNIVEADVVFWNGIPYTTSMTKTSHYTYGGSSRPFQTTCMHEYGHAGGLGHEADEYNIMGTDWTHVTCNGSTVRAYLGEDACDGYYDIYGATTSSIEDLSLTILKRTGASGEYSSHGFGVMRNSSTNGLLSRASDYQGQPRWRVNRGQRVKVEFTLENNGKTTKTSRLGFYVSSNSTISTVDRLIATANPTLSRDNVLTYAYTLTIPSDLSVGTTYFLGAIIDDNSRVGEIDGINNAAYHVIYVQ